MDLFDWNFMPSTTSETFVHMALIGDLDRKKTVHFRCVFQLHSLLLKLQQMVVRKLENRNESLWKLCLILCSTSRKQNFLSL